MKKTLRVSTHLRDALANEGVLAIVLQLHWHVELGAFDVFKHLLELLANVANFAALAAVLLLELVQDADDLKV